MKYEQRHIGGYIGPESYTKITAGTQGMIHDGK
jgi:hypothetical protein